MINNANHTRCLDAAPFNGGSNSMDFEERIDVGLHSPEAVAHDDSNVRAFADGLLRINDQKTGLGRVLGPDEVYYAASRSELIEVLGPDGKHEVNRVGGDVSFVEAQREVAITDTLKAMTAAVVWFHMREVGLRDIDHQEASVIPVADLGHYREVRMARRLVEAAREKVLPHCPIEYLKHVS